MATDYHLKELRVAVTGGTSGLGLALVRCLVARGAHVAFVARNARAVEQIAHETGGYRIVGDVGRKEDIYPIALQITTNLRGLDVLINNASALGPTPSHCSPTLNAKNWSRRSGSICRPHSD